MTVAMMVDNPEGSQEIYDRVRDLLGLEKPAGGIFHVAGPSPNGGWRVIELFASEEDAQRFVAAPQVGLRGNRRPRPAAATAVLARAQLHDLGDATMNSGSGSPLKELDRTTRGTASAWMRASR
jgi:hypothetical protein